MMNHYGVQIGAQGRMVIPADLRKFMDLNPGDALMAHLE